ncbi:hypothetical protein [Propionibacterium cyclohexanicum]|uniref:hypothetical protein n=1 Tax=Propionibacterium cyclohexanicum TaxID=64702 RepID=UPI001C433A30|nr:hypothetical protein [Propionibacterium cyclohexanicum]
MTTVGMTVLHAFDEATDAGLSKLGVAAKVLLPADASLFCVSIPVDVWRAKQRDLFVASHGPSLVDEIENCTGSGGQ